MISISTIKKRGRRERERERRERSKEKKNKKTKSEERSMGKKKLEDNKGIERKKLLIHINLITYAYLGVS